MKIGILCTMINRFGRKGFYNSQEIGLGRMLAGMGHQVIIWKGLKSGGGETVYPAAGLTVHYITLKGIGAHGWLNANVINKDMDAVFCFCDNQIFIPHIIRYCQRHHIMFIPYIGTAHSIYTDLHGKIMNAIFAAGTLRFYKSHPVFAKNETAVNELHTLGVNDITLAYVGLDIASLRQDYLDYSKADIRTELGVAPDATVIGYVSHLDPIKHPLELIDLFDRIKDQKNFTLLIVGEGELKDQMLEKIHSKGLENRIKYYSRMPYSDMWKVYRASDYYLNLCYEEIFGMAIMEAISYRVPVIAYEAAGPDVIMDGMAGHCLCKTEKDVEEILLKPYPAERDLEESAEKVRNDFSWRRCAEAIVSLIASQKQKGSR